MAADPPKADPAKAIEAIRDARPPETDRFTYLTIVEANLCPEVLPTLNEVLQDAELTQEIGWDLVFNLVNLPGSDACLETVARLGNPREVILKVLETLELLGGDDGEDEEEEEEGTEGKPEAAVSSTHKFITLLGMLAILHRRIKTKYPSRFLAQTLHTVYGAYRPNQEMTASVINLVHSLSGARRPPLPSRKSSVNVANPDQDGDASKNAPDPEADREDREDPDETDLQQKLLLSFATCILEAYTNGNEMAWAARLLEFYNPEKIVPGRRTLMAAFREEQELLARDAIVGKLVVSVYSSSCQGTVINVGRRSSAIWVSTRAPRASSTSSATGRCTASLWRNWVTSPLPTRLPSRPAAASAWSPTGCFPPPSSTPSARSPKCTSSQNILPCWTNSFRTTRKPRSRTRSAPSKPSSPSACGCSPTTSSRPTPRPPSPTQPPPPRTPRPTLCATST